MLSEIQLQKLEPYTKHEKYGKIVEAAIITWKYIRPSFDTYGVYWQDVHKCYAGIASGCCLLGASLHDKQFQNKPQNRIEAVCLMYSLSEVENDSMMSGFDDSVRSVNPKLAYWDHDAYMFGFSVGKIVFNLDTEQKQ